MTFLRNKLIIYYGVLTNYLFIISIPSSVDINNTGRNSKMLHYSPNLPTKRQTRKWIVSSTGRRTVKNLNIKISFICLWSFQYRLPFDNHILYNFYFGAARLLKSSTKKKSEYFPR